MISIPPKFKKRALPKAAPSPPGTVSAEYRFAGDGVAFLSLGQAIVSPGTVSLVAFSLEYRFTLNTVSLGTVALVYRFAGMLFLFPQIRCGVYGAPI